MSKSKQGWLELGGKRKFYRSMWEANIARYFQHLKETGKIADWDHEPDTFWFEKIKRGVRSYLPDFKVTYCDGTVAYYEVKGYMDGRSKTKIKRMRIYHPTVVLIVIDSKQYRSLASLWKDIVPGWGEDFG